MSPRDGHNRPQDAPQPSERGKTWGLVPRRYTANQRALARVCLPQLLADLAATPDPCPGCLIGSGPGEPSKPGSVDKTRVGTTSAGLAPIRSDVENSEDC